MDNPVFIVAAIASLAGALIFIVCSSGERSETVTTKTDARRSTSVTPTLFLSRPAGSPCATPPSVAPPPHAAPNSAGDTENARTYPNTRHADDPVMVFARQSA
jgi:hypothetical protein